MLLVALALRTLPLRESTQRLPVDFIGLGMLITWVGCLQIDRGHPPRGALGERQPRGRLGEALALGLPLRVEQGPQAVEVRREVHGAGSTAHSVPAAP